ncbi:MAG TPA: hypothetical protein VL988_02845 [Solirubrobacteraceae bacterium]|nr:hypothetical protein [Solirubrobacteraceae bacterium]
MNKTYEEALEGTLKSQLGVNLGAVTFYNYLPVDVGVIFIDYSGVLDLDNRLTVPAATGGTPGSAKSLEVEVGNYFLLQIVDTGGFAGVITIVAGKSSYDIVDATLLAPNDIGRFPVPAGTTLIPQDSTRRTVGTGLLPTGQVLLREQYWHLMPESYCLAPEETKIVSLTSTSGMEQTSSQLDTVAASLNVSASAGWGVVSASVSASLSKNSTTFQQVTITEQSVSSTSDQLENSGKTPVMYLKWQLTEALTFFDSKGPVACIELGQDPVLVAGPYDPNQLLDGPREPSRQEKLERSRAATRARAQS